MTQTALDLTIAIPVRNEERNLLNCLEAIGKDFAQNIFVIDSESTDKTCIIAKEFGAEVVNFIWNGQFPKKRNWFLRNHTPVTKWILFLDADEYITVGFKEELRVALSEDDKAGYWLNYTIYFMGKKLKGGYPLRKLALFRVGAGEYEELNEQQWSKFDMEIHEHPILKGKIGFIKSKIDHQDFKGIAHYISKHSEYAAWEAKRFIALSNSGGRSSWTWKQHIKYRLIQTVWIGPLFFIGSYFVLGGIRDGGRGLSFAILKMSYFNQVYCKILEHKNCLKNNCSA